MLNEPWQEVSELVSTAHMYSPCFASFVLPGTTVNVLPNVFTYNAAISACEMYPTFSPTNATISACEQLQMHRHRKRAVLNVVWLSAKPPCLDSSTPEEKQVTYQRIFCEHCPRQPGS